MNHQQRQRFANKIRRMIADLATPARHARYTRSPLPRTSARLWVTSLLATLVASSLLAVADPAQAAATRSGIVSVAQAELGASEANRLCLKYGPCTGVEWCAMFAGWVWRQAGVSPVFTTYTARAVGLWGQQRGLFKTRPAGGVGSPQPGDVVVYGTPANTVGGHVSIVASVNSNGTIDTIDGNWSERVVRRTINPVTATAGADGLHISGYVNPPNLASAGVPRRPRYDFSTDAVADVMAISTTGELRYFPNNIGTTGAPVTGYTVNGPGWTAFDRVLAGDISGDGVDDLLATTPAGELYYFPNNISSDPSGLPFGNGILTGQGWNGISRLFLADVSGDGYADIMAITPSGELRFYPNGLIVNGGVPFSSYRYNGSGWDTVGPIALADVSGDRVADLVARNAAGQLCYYPNNIGSNPGGVPFSNCVPTGSGPNLNRLFLADISGDTYPDLVATTTAGELRYYPNGILVNGGIPFGSHIVTGQGWNSVNQMTVADFSADGAADILGAVGDTLYYYPNNSGSQGGIPFVTAAATGNGWNSMIMIL